MKLLRISKSLVHFMTIISMVMSNVALIAASDEVWARSAADCEKLYKDCDKKATDLFKPPSVCATSDPTTAATNNGCTGPQSLANATAECQASITDVNTKCQSDHDKCKDQCPSNPLQISCETKIQDIMKTLGGGATAMGGYSVSSGATAGSTCLSQQVAGVVDSNDNTNLSPANGGTDSTTNSAPPAGPSTSPSAGPSTDPSTSPGTSPGTKPSSAGTGGGGGGGMGALSSLLPLAAMAAMMMAKKNNNNNNASTAAVNGYASPDGVVDASGKVNCGATYAYRYSYCDTQVAQACMANITTMAGSQVCEQFSARYCNQGYSAPSFYSQCPYPYTAGETCGTSYFTTPSPTQATQVDIVGAGVGSGYCLRATQIAFCASATNAQCPSCLQLQSLQSTACVNNPALCNVVNSSTTSASQVAACPATDPLVAAGIISGSANVVAGTTTAPTTLPVTAPPAVLPLASASTASAGGLQVASAINGIGARSPASAGDVAPEYGTSLFNAGSTPLSQRCNAGLFNHCIRN